MHRMQSWFQKKIGTRYLETLKLLSIPGMGKSIKTSSPLDEPDLNPIENDWAILKGKLRKIVTNFQNLFDALTAVFQTI